MPDDRDMSVATIAVPQAYRRHVLFWLLTRDADMSVARRGDGWACVSFPARLKAELLEWVASQAAVDTANGRRLYDVLVEIHARVRLRAESAQDADEKAFALAFWRLDEEMGEERWVESFEVSPDVAEEDDTPVEVGVIGDGAAASAGASGDPEGDAGGLHSAAPDRGEALDGGWRDGLSDVEEWLIAPRTPAPTLPERSSAPSAGGDDDDLSQGEMRGDVWIEWTDEDEAAADAAMEELNAKWAAEDAARERRRRRARERYHAAMGRLAD